MEKIIETYIRDIKICLINEDYPIKISPERQYDSYQFFRKNNKIIEYVKSIGGVLTGSRALKCYKLGNNYLLDRKVKDWDFIITHEMVLDICYKFNIEYDLVSKFININESFFSFHNSYSDDLNILGTNIHLIIKDKLPTFKEVDGVRFSNLIEIFDNKVRIMMDNKLNNLKHLKDLSNFIIKFNGFKKELNI